MIKIQIIIISTLTLLLSFAICCGQMSDAENECLNTLDTAVFMNSVIKDVTLSRYGETNPMEWKVEAAFYKPSKILSNQLIKDSVFQEILPIYMQYLSQHSEQNNAQKYPWKFVVNYPTSTHYEHFQAMKTGQDSRLITFTLPVQINKFEWVISCAYCDESVISTEFFLYEVKRRKIKRLWSFID